MPLQLVPYYPEGDLELFLFRIPLCVALLVIHFMWQVHGELAAGGGGGAE